jgi:hypothetical protein
MKKRIFSFLFALFFSVMGVTAFGQVSISLPTTGENTGAVPVTVTSSVSKTFVTVGVVMPTSANAYAQKLESGATVSALGLYYFDGTGAHTFDIAASLLPEAAGGYLYVIGGSASGDAITVHDLKSYQYVPQPVVGAVVPEIISMATANQNAFSASSDGTVISLTINNLNGTPDEILYCRILPAGVPFSVDRLPDILVTSATNSYIGGSYAGNTFRVPITNNLGGGLYSADITIDGSTLARINREYLNNMGSQIHQFREGFYLHALVLTNNAVSQYKTYYFNWNQETLSRTPVAADNTGEPYGIRVYQTKETAPFSAGYFHQGVIRPTISYLTDFDISIRYTPDVTRESSISPKKLMFKINPDAQSYASGDGWSLSNATLVTTSFNNLQPNTLYVLDYSDPLNTPTTPMLKHFNLQQLLQENGGTIKLLVKAVHDGGTTNYVEDATKEYTFTSEELFVDHNRPSYLRGTGTLTETPFIAETNRRDPSGSYGWFIEQNGALVNTVNVNEPFMIAFATNFLNVTNVMGVVAPTGNRWDGGEDSPRLLIHDVANERWTSHSSISGFMIMKHQGAPVPGTFGSTSFNNYYTFVVNDYFKLMGISKEDYVEGGRLELTFGSFANSPTITRRATGVNTYPIYTSTGSRIVPEVTLAPSNVSAPYRFETAAPANIGLNVNPFDSRLRSLSTERENTRIYFVIGPTGYIDTRKAWEYNTGLNPIQPGRTYYTWNNSPEINFDAFLTNSPEVDTLSIRTQALVRNTYQDHLRVWQYNRGQNLTSGQILDLSYSQYEVVGENLHTTAEREFNTTLSGGFWYMKDPYSETGVKEYLSGIVPYVNTAMMFGSDNQTRVFTYYYWVPGSGENPEDFTSTESVPPGAYTVSVAVTPIKSPTEPAWYYDSGETFDGGFEMSGNSQLTASSPLTAMPTPGHYSFVTEIDAGLNPDWNDGFTSPTLDEFFLVNLQGVPLETVIYHRYGKEICEGTEFSFSMQMASAIDRNAPTYGVKPDVEIRIVEVEQDGFLPDGITPKYSPIQGNPVLSSVRTGDVEMSGTWQDVRVAYTPSSQIRIGVEIINKESSALEGNALAIDNVRYGVPAVPATIIERFTTSCPDPEYQYPNEDGPSLDNPYGKTLIDSNNCIDLVLSFDMNAMERFLTDVVHTNLTDVPYYYYLYDKDNDVELFLSGQETYAMGAEGARVNEIVLGRNGHALPRPKMNGNLILYLLFNPAFAPTTAEDFTEALCAWMLPYEYVYRPTTITATGTGVTPGPNPTTDTEGTYYTVPAGNTVNLKFDAGDNDNVDRNKLVWFYYHGDGTMHDMKQRYTGDAITVNPIRSTSYGVHLPECDIPIAVCNVIVTGTGIEFGTDEYAMRASKPDLYVYRTLFDPTADRIVIPLQSAPYPSSFRVTDDEGELLPWLESVRVIEGTEVDAITGATMALELNLNSAPILENYFRTGSNALSLKIHSNNEPFNMLFDVRFISPTTAWQGLFSNDWNDERNWKYYRPITTGAEGANIQTNSSPGVPLPGTKVFIPGTLSTNRYPDLTTSLNTVLTTDDGASKNPIADEITFEQGSVLGGQYLLYYHKAFVELNFGTSNSSGTYSNNRSTSDALKRERYYMLSAPLKNMYAGDLFMGARPSVFPRYTEVHPIYPADKDLEWGNDFTAIDALTLSNSTPTYEIPLDLGFAFAYGMAGGLNQNSDPEENPNLTPFAVGNINPNIPVSYDQTNIDKKGGVVKYPRFENEKWGSDVKPISNRKSAVSGRTYPHAIGTDPYGFSHYESFLPDANGGWTAYRYSYQGEPDLMFPDGWQGRNWIEEVRRNNYTTPDYGLGAQTVYEGNRFIIEQSGTRAVTGPNNTGEPIALGNPFMAYLNLTDFYRGNGYDAMGTFYILEGDNVYTIQTWPTGTTNRELVSGGAVVPLSEIGSLVNLNPMQGFFFVPKAAKNTPFSLKFDASMTRSSKSVQTNDPSGSGLGLRSTNDPYSLLTVSVSNDRGVNATTVVRHNMPDMPEEGAALLMSPAQKTPEIFVNKGGNFEAISYFSETVTSIPLGVINISKDSRFTLSVDGLDQIPEDQVVYLYDSKLAEEKILTTQNNTYVVEGVVNTEEENLLLLNRFFIGLRDATGTSVLETPVSNVSAWLSNRILNVTSDLNDLIKQVRIYNVQGSLLAMQGNLSTPSFQTTLNLPAGVYLVDIKTENHSLIQKIVVK